VILMREGMARVEPPRPIGHPSYKQEGRGSCRLDARGPGASV